GGRPGQGHPPGGLGGRGQGPAAEDARRQAHPQPAQPKGQHIGEPPGEGKLHPVGALPCQYEHSYEEEVAYGCKNYLAAGTQGTISTGTRAFSRTALLTLPRMSRVMAWMPRRPMTMTSTFSSSATFRISSAAWPEARRISPFRPASCILRSARLAMRRGSVRASSAISSTHSGV